MSTKRVGLIARCDNGGLGNQSWEFFNHIGPERVVIVDLGDSGRGRSNRERFTTPHQDCSDFDFRVNDGRNLSDENATWLARECDVVMTFETSYSQTFWDIAREHGTKTVLMVHVEQFDRMDTPDEIWVPTPYRTDLLSTKNPYLVPWPVATSRMPCRDVRKNASVFAHLRSSSRYDRNGTKIVEAAVKSVKTPCEMVVVGDGRASGRFARSRQNRRVETSVLGSHEDYRYVVPCESDVLVLPRRYAGLCMTVDEAQAKGIPSIMLDVEPYRGVLGVHTVKASRGVARRMRGGAFHVAQADGRHLADVMDRLMSDGELVEKLSQDALRRADMLSWDLWAERYDALLRHDVPYAKVVDKNSLLKRKVL